MRERFVRRATVVTAFFLLLIGPQAWAQQQSERGAGEQARNPAGRAEQNQGAAQNRHDNANTPRTETVRGVIAAITAEGEIVLDYRTNAAALLRVHF